ncbi:hypothetical protein [Photobacterium sanctipauli]|nr:hypothetical protein [Photobacterium sanctipauli]
MYDFEPEDMDYIEDVLWDESQSEIEYDDWFESEGHDDDYQ